MAGRPTVVSQGLVATLAEHIREGTYAWVAAEAAGISRRTFYYWMARGERGEEPYVMVATMVHQAQAQARMRAEKWVQKHSPLSWLRFGPGRERPGRPGWTHSVPAQAEEAPEEYTEGEVDAAMMAELEEALR